MKNTMGNGCKRVSPYPANGNNVRNVNPAGNVNNNNANNANGVAPDCENSQKVVSHYRPNPEHSCKEWLSSPEGDSGENTAIDAASFKKAESATNNGIKEKVCGFGELYKAAHTCKKNVLWKDSTAGFIKNALRNCYVLNDELMNNNYKISTYSIFEVHEKKTRTIVSTRIRDRTFQRSLCDNYFTKQLSRSFIYDNCACLPGKGTDMARERLKHHLRRHYRKHGINGYVLKVDIHDFFGSTSHEVVKKAVRKRIDDEWVVMHIDNIVDSFTHITSDRGMGLGSQITQLTQLAVLDDLDHIIKEKLRIKGYVRYMDDFVLIHESKEYLKTCLKTIQTELEKNELKLNEKKTSIQPVDRGIHFLGFSFRLTKTGRIVQTLLHKKISKQRQKLKRMVNLVKQGKLTKEKVDQSFNDWKAHVSKGNCKTLIKRMELYYDNLFQEKEGKECSNSNHSTSRSETCKKKTQNYRTKQSGVEQT